MTRTKSGSSHKPHETNGRPPKRSARKETTEKKVLKIDADKIPQYLRDIPHWIGVRLEAKKNGKWTKIPVHPRTGYQIDPTDPANGLPFEEALAAATELGLDGLGFILTKEVGVTVLDADGCRELQGARYKQYAIDLVNQLDSYTELSISGQGLHIFLLGNLPEDIGYKNNGTLELLNSKRYIVVTGNRLRPTKRGKWKQNLSHDIEERQEALLDLLETQFTKQLPTIPRECLVDPTDTYLDQLQFKQLMRVPQAQDIYEGRHKIFPSQSDADYCLGRIAVEHGWENAQQLCALLVGARANAGAPEKPNPVDYFSRTVMRCLAVDSIALPLEKAMTIFGQHLYIEDPDLFHVVLGVVAANHTGSDPVWLFIVAPPSSGKTAILQALHGYPGVKPLSDLTTKAGISGYDLEDSTKKDHSLFSKLHGKTLVIKDYTTQVSKNEQERAELEGQLRDMYDGETHKSFGTGERHITSTFNLLAGVTNSIEDTYENASLGERFLRYYTDITDPFAAAVLAGKSANNQDIDPKRNRDIARAALGVLKYVEDLPIPDVPDPLIERIVRLAIILGTLRANVERHHNGGVKRTPAPEKPPRVTRQLVRLAKGIARVRGKAIVDEDEMRILYKITRESTTELRRRIFQLLAAEDREFPESAIVSALPGLSIKIALNDLAVLNIIVERTDKQTGKLSKSVRYYRLTDAFRTLVYDSGMLPRPTHPAVRSAARKGVTAKK